MAAAYTVPEQYGGKTWQDIFRESERSGEYFPRLDILTGQLGVSPNTPLTAGQTFYSSIDPSSGEGQYLARKLTAGGTGGVGSGSAGNWQDTLKQAQKLYSEAVAPYAQQVRAGASNINDYYNQLLSRITGDVTNVKSAEYGKRGIPLSSGAYATDVQRTTAPYVESAAQQKTSALQNILDLAAQIESGALTSGANAGLSIYGTQMNSADNAASNALRLQELQQQAANSSAQLAQNQSQFDTTAAANRYNYMTIGGRIKVVDTQTNQVVGDLGSSTSGTGTGAVDPTKYYTDETTPQTVPNLSTNIYKNTQTNQALEKALTWRPDGGGLQWQP